MDIRQLAFLLLVGRIIAVIFMLYVLYQQFRLVRLPPPDSFQGKARQLFIAFRYTLFALGIIVLVGNFIPVLIDTATLLNQVHGRRSPPPLLAAYGLSNSFSDAAAAVALAIMYKLAKMIDRILP